MHFDWIGFSLLGGKVHFPPNKELQKEFAAQIDVLVTISVFYDLSPGHLTEEMLFHRASKIQ